jgi:hypothetical protein
MLIEGLVAGIGGLTTWLYLNGKDKRKIRKDWKETLLNCKVEGVRFDVKSGNVTIKKTFLLNKLYHAKYGWLGICNVPHGLKFSALESAKEALENTFGCRLEMEKDVDKKRNTYGKIKFIFNTEDMMFEPHKTTADKIFIGYKVDGSPYFLDLNLDPHILIGGETGTGKSFLMACIIANMCWSNPKEFNLYLLQIMKAENDMFKDCKPVVIATSDLKLISQYLKKGANMVNERAKEFAQYGIVSIGQYNKFFPKQKMKREIFITEEVSFFMPNDSDDEEIKKLKMDCWNSILTIVKAGRSCGISLFSITQRSTCTNLPSDVKAQLTRITGKQKSVIDSTNIINTSDAVTLNKEKHQFICDGTEYVYLTAPLLDDDKIILNKYVPELRVPNEEDIKRIIKEKEEKLSKEKEDNTMNKNNSTKSLIEFREQLTLEEYTRKYGNIYENNKRVVKSPLVSPIKKNINGRKEI